jgi:hypothetical protein
MVNTERERKGYWGRREREIREGGERDMHIRYELV